jgi:hypothetical protein
MSCPVYSPKRTCETLLMKALMSTKALGGMRRALTVALGGPRWPKVAPAKKSPRVSMASVHAQKNSPLAHTPGPSLVRAAAGISPTSWQRQRP